jgi:chemotaxis protein MotB
MADSRVLLLAAALGGACGAPAQEQPPPKTAEKPPEVSALEKVDHDVKRVKEISELDRSNVEKQVKIGEMEKKIAELQARLDAAVKTSAPEEPEGQKRENNVETTGGNKVRVRLSGELVFTPGSARITRAGRKVLSDVAKVLKDTPHKRIEVAGHSDSTPIGKKYEDNWQLSSERARRVVAYLHSEGVDGKHMIAAGYADTEPVEQGSSDDANRKNRRVEIYIEPQ